MPKKATKKTAGDQAWSVKIPAGSTFCGPIKYVDFAYGQGVLCLKGLARHRADLVDITDDVQLGGVPLSEYARYFRQKGFEVKAMPVAEAEALLDDVLNSPEKFKPEEVEATAEPDPVKDLTSNQPAEGGEEGSQEEGAATEEGTEPAAEAAGEDLPPHEQKG
jgi:hypothetical protein